MVDAAELVSTTRGNFVECRHFGHAVIARSSGEIVAAWGDPSKIVLPRSSIKMVQALPLVESEIGKRLSAEQLALASASHSAEPQHIKRVADWLSDLGLDEGALLCGPTPPIDQDRRDQLIREGEDFKPIHSDCSGKHAGFLAMCQVTGGGYDYVDPDHLVQRGVRRTIEDLAEETSPGFGIDGCAAPNFALSLAGLAKVMARFAESGSSSRSRAMQRLRDAMMLHPELVSGTGRSCANLMRAAKGKAAVKTGADGMYTGILPSAGLGIAIKIEDGAKRASEAVMAALLIRCGAIGPDDVAIQRYLEAPIYNFSGAVVGHVRPSKELFGTKLRGG